MTSRISRAPRCSSRRTTATPTWSGCSSTLAPTSTRRRPTAPALRRRHGLVKVIGVRDRNRTQALATQCGGRLCSKCTRIIFQVDWVNTRCRVCSDAKNAKSAAALRYAQAKKEAEAQGDLIVQLDEHIVQQEQLIDRVKLIYNRFVFQPRSLVGSVWYLMTGQDIDRPVDDRILPYGGYVPPPTPTPPSSDDEDDEVTFPLECDPPLFSCFCIHVYATLTPISYSPPSHACRHLLSSIPHGCFRVRGTPTSCPLQLQ